MSTEASVEAGADSVGVVRKGMPTFFLFFSFFFFLEEEEAPLVLSATSVWLDVSVSCAGFELVSERALATAEEGCVVWRVVYLRGMRLSPP